MLVHGDKPEAKKSNKYVEICKAGPRQGCDRLHNGLKREPVFVDSCYRQVLGSLALVSWSYPGNKMMTPKTLSHTWQHLREPQNPCFKV